MENVQRTNAKTEPHPSPAKHNCRVCDFPMDFYPGKISTCDQCGARDRRHTLRSTRLSLVFSLTALIFYIPANIFPFMTFEMYGGRTTSTILSGVRTLMEQRSYFIAVVVFLASVLIPIMKLLILFYLSLTATNGQHPRFKMNLYHFVEGIGRWSMLDIFLLAILVTLVKLGHWGEVHPERGAWMFAVVVIFTMMASAYFDPRILWKRAPDSQPTKEES